MRKKNPIDFGWHDFLFLPSPAVRRPCPPPRSAAASEAGRPPARPCGVRRPAPSALPLQAARARGAATSAQPGCPPPTWRGERPKVGGCVPLGPSLAASARAGHAPQLAPLAGRGAVVAKSGVGLSTRSPTPSLSSSQPPAAAPPAASSLSTSEEHHSPLPPDSRTTSLDPVLPGVAFGDEDPRDAEIRLLKRQLFEARREREDVLTVVQTYSGPGPAPGAPQSRLATNPAAKPALPFSPREPLRRTFDASQLFYPSDVVLATPRSPTLLLPGSSPSFSSLEATGNARAAARRQRLFGERRARRRKGLRSGGGGRSGGAPPPFRDGERAAAGTRKEPQLGGGLPRGLRRPGGERRDAE